MTGVLGREFFDRPVLEVAPDLLGCRVVHGGVTVRLTEVEAYDGPADPASHAYRGRTPRNAVMFGPPGHVYVYFTYGMHWCVNLVCGPDEHASAVLLRAGEVVDGLGLARGRRPTARRDRDLARGPACLAQAMGLTGDQNGLDACGSGSFSAYGRAGGPHEIGTGPRVGVRTGARRPWRFWLAGEPTVSAYKPAAPPRRRYSAGAGKTG